MKLVGLCGYVMKKNWDAKISPLKGFLECGDETSERVVRVSLVGWFWLLFGDGEGKC
jgi:hypothetical protein